MDTVINKISEIESAATAIMDDANLRKKALAKEMEERTAAFDAELEAETSKRIEALTQKLEEDLQKRLTKQKSDAQKLLSLMEKHYERFHEKSAQELFKKIIEE